MNNFLTYSDSLIENLCREIDYIRQRYNNVTISLSISKDKLLKERLAEEILNLKQRRKELTEISNTLDCSNKTSLSKLLFCELCRRPLEIKV